MLFDERGAAVRLGRKIGRTGGEGNVYVLDGTPAFVAKIYHRPADIKIAKLRCLTKRETPQLRECTAWPRSILFDEHRQPRGFAMRAVSGKEIHHLFGPRDRVVDFPGKNWDFLVHTARNCAAAFDEVHAVGAVIGDVNEGNVLVQTNGCVTLIDCDSYQITNSVTSWTCDVGVPLWTPPELQGRNFRGLSRTTNHDLFGLAILIFKLLFMGRHPFAGIYLDRNDHVLEDAITRQLYAFSPIAHTYGIRPPPHSFPVTSLPEFFLSLFERAFRHTLPRPNAKEWVHALDSIRQAIVQCARDASHRFPRFLAHCPWCEIAAAGGPLFFVSVDAPVTFSLGDNVGAIWATISKIQRANLVFRDLTNVVTATPTALPPNALRLRGEFVFGILLFLAAILLFIAGSVFLGLIAAVFAIGMVCDGPGTPEFAEERARRRDAVNVTERDIKSLTDQLSNLIKRYEADFDGKLTELRQVYQRYSGLDQEKHTELRRLEQQKRQLQLDEFLKNQLVSRVKISGIGDVRKQRLLSFGIGSAFDVRPNLQIPGFGATNMSHLLNWRAACEGRFRFEPARPVPPVEIQRINLKIATLRADLLGQLKAGPSALAALSAGAQGRYLQLQGQLEVSATRYAQARADLPLVA